jgi:hypothetical protein
LENGQKSKAREIFKIFKTESAEQVKPEPLPNITPSPMPLLES